MRRKKIAWTFVGPDGNTHEFRNLIKFVETDGRSLFDPADLVILTGRHCRAYFKLAGMRKHNHQEWKGWRYIGEPPNKKVVISDEHRKNLTKALRGRRMSAEARKQQSDLRKGKDLYAEHPWNVNDETHHSASSGVLRAPDGQIYHYRNLSHFVRTHAHLFDEEDLALDTKGDHRARAYLARLRPSKNIDRIPPSSWKGWTHVTTIEKNRDNH
jgi:hypothetical protein